MNNSEISTLRKQLDEIDLNLIQAFSKRHEIVKKIGNLKKTQDMKALDQKRWTHLLEDRVKKGKKCMLSKKFITSIWEIIHTESLKIQEDKL